MAVRELFKAAVFIIIRDEQGRVLLMRRKNTGFMDGYYDFPSGHVDPGESFTESAVREVAEETGLTVKETDLELCHLNQNYLDSPYINVVFAAKAWAGIPNIMEPEKCDDLGFWPIEALPQKCTLAVRYTEKTGWGGGPHLSKVNPDDFRALIGVPYNQAYPDA